MADAAYFLGGGLPLSERRAHERELFGEYLERLREAGAALPDFDACWEQYRRHTFGGVLMATLASMIVERTARGDEMFVTMLARHAQHHVAELLPPERRLDALEQDEVVVGPRHAGRAERVRRPVDHPRAPTGQPHLVSESAQVRARKRRLNR